MSALRRVAAPLAAIACIAVAACGDEPSEDEAQITDVIERVATGGDPADCTEIQTQRFVEQVAGEGLKGAAAVKACERNADHGAADSADVSEVEIDGDRATANVEISGSTFDGQTLELALVNDGEGWKVDEFTDFAVFDRDQMIASLSEEMANFGAPQDGVDCVTENLEGLSDEEIRAYLLNPSPENVQTVFGPCEQLLSGRSPERTKLADVLRNETEIPDGPDWMTVAFDSLWVKQDSGGVVRLDPATGKTLAEIAPSSSGGHLCQGIGATEEAIWSCPRDGVIDRIDPATNAVTASLRIDKFPDQGRLVGSAGMVWLLTEGGEELSAVDPDTNEVEGSVKLGAACADLAADGRVVWAVCPVDGRVLRVDADALEVTGEIELEGAANASVADDLWVSHEGGLEQIDRRTLEAIATYDVGSAYGGSVLATDDAVWARQDGGPFLTQIDPRAREIVRTIEAPNLPSGGDVVELGDSLWATAYDDATLVELREE